MELALHILYLMTREEIIELGLKEVGRHKCIIAQLPTSFGKTKFAISLTNRICDRVFENDKDETSILILVPTIFLKEEWKKEIDKWGGIKSDRIIMECYNSIHKYKGKYFDIVICDELQHLSEARKQSLEEINISYNLIGLSATLPKRIYEWITSKYDCFCIKETIQGAINNDILPDPTIYLMPLFFDKSISECIYRNKEKKLPIIKSSWENRWKYFGKNAEIQVQCTKMQYLTDLNSQIEWYKNKAMRGNAWAKTKWLKLCNDRLKWLSSCKNSVLLPLLEKLKTKRTITFCSSIEQSEILGKNCINSKNKNSSKNLIRFNNKRLSHITACNMLNEGANLVECQVGIFANINASDIITTQRIGRILRHRNPIIILPYYKSTREEELIKKHLEGYNPDLIKVIHNINQIEL